MAGTEHEEQSFGDSDGQGGRWARERRHQKRGVESYGLRVRFKHVFKYDLKGLLYLGSLNTKVKLTAARFPLSSSVNGCFSVFVLLFCVVCVCVCMCVCVLVSFSL